MKNVIKKITAAAMAFTLLGAGTTAINNIAPKFENTITASAAGYDNDYWNHTKPGSGECFGIGSKGDKVKWIQCVMNHFYGVMVWVDGNYDWRTRNAVRNFQNLFNDGYYGRWGRIDVDGIFGPQTWRAVNIALKKFRR